METSLRYTVTIDHNSNQDSDILEFTAFYKAVDAYHETLNSEDFRGEIWLEIIDQDGMCLDELHDIKTSHGIK